MSLPVLLEQVEVAASPSPSLECDVQMQNLSAGARPFARSSAPDSPPKIPAATDEAAGSSGLLEKNSSGPTPPPPNNKEKSEICYEYDTGSDLSDLDDDDGGVADLLSLSRDYAVWARVQAGAFDAKNFEDYQFHKIAKFSSVERFSALYQHLERPSRIVRGIFEKQSDEGGADTSDEYVDAIGFFKDGYFPSVSSSASRSRWDCRLPAKHVLPVEVDAMWLEVVAHFVSNQFPEPVIGVLLCPREKNVVKIELWMDLCVEMEPDELLVKMLEAEAEGAGGDGRGRGGGKNELSPGGGKTRGSTSTTSSTSSTSLAAVHERIARMAPFRLNLLKAKALKQDEKRKAEAERSMRRIGKKFRALLAKASEKNCGPGRTGWADVVKCLCLQGDSRKVLMRYPEKEVAAGEQARDASQAGGDGKAK